MTKKSDFEKHDQDKSRLELVPPHALTEVGYVFGYGAKKYDDNNWMKVDKRSRYVGAAERHIQEYKGGGNLDPESRRHVLAHAICSLMMLLECEMMNHGRDDRAYQTKDQP